MTQAAMGVLFDVAPQNITMHLQNVYAEGELSADATCKDFLQVQTEGGRQVSRRLKHYNLDAIIAVGSLARCRFSGMMVRKTEKSPSPNRTRYFTT